MAASTNPPQLQPFDVILTPQPKPPPRPKSQYSILNSLIHFFTLNTLSASSLIWMSLILCYGTMPWLSSPVNAWFHTTAFKLFLAFGILWIYLLCPLVKNMLQAFHRELRVYPIVLSLERVLARIYDLAVFGVGVFAIAMVCVNDPVVRSCTREDYPIQLKLLSARNSVRGLVEMRTKEGSGIWDLTHYPLQANPDVYSFQLWRWRHDEHENKFANGTWPKQSAVREVLYYLNGEKGDMLGYCGLGKTKCLNGTVEMNPLRLEWTYIDPLTFERKEKLLENEGQWNFGRRHRPWVNLRDATGKSVFSAPSSKWICGAGDGDLRTTIVPAGIIMIAEQNYNGRY